MTKKELSETGKLYALGEKLGSMIDKFSETWGEKALDPRNFLEVAQEMKNLKKEIKEMVENSGLGKEKFESYIQKMAFDLSESSGKRTLKDRLDDIALGDQARLFEAERCVAKREGLPLDFVKNFRNKILDYAIILNALAGGADKPVEEQLKDFKFITRKDI